MDLTHGHVAPQPIRGRAHPVWDLVKDTLSAWSDDDASTHAAALAYYAAFSIAPVLVIALAIVSALFGRDAAHGQLHVGLQSVLGDSAARAAEQLVANAARPGGGVIATVLGVAVLIFAATGAFSELQNALNAFWKVPPHRTDGVLPFLKRRAISIVMVLAIGALLLASVAGSAALSALGARAGAMRIAEQVLSFAVVTGLFALIFKVLPDRRIAWRDVWAGTLVSSVLFSLGKLAIGFYVARTSFASAYGAAGAIAVLLAWVYYSSMILFLGAELTQVFAHRYGSLRGAASRTFRTA